MEILETMRIGTLHPEDVLKAKKDSKLNENDPYVRDPLLAPVMTYHQRKPINAEPPAFLLTDSWVTPSSLWFVRNHHPIPYLDSSNYSLAIQSENEADRKDLGTLSLSDLRTRFKPHSIVATLQCGGNRRAEMNELGHTNGSPWKVSAISTAQWKGALLRDVLKSWDINEDNAEEQGFKHVQFLSADGLEASIPIRKALSRHGDVILAYEMNGEALPAKHGFPIRVSYYAFFLIDYI
jgi:sulfite oxidase